MSVFWYIYYEIIKPEKEKCMDKPIKIILIASEND